ncbi:3-(3-hydroxy-phenyl)propionate/3-hydroxycinnamic acid hydroxylase [Pseudovibrio sp. Ad46]|uniref:FAD-dependent oxidoreductase n=1 Tax=Pseudovibrio sp. Ad46 TaxID=989432 RepID=UPI0007AE6854|nr:FAD-dependent oxidoreductase [Pseudovibrio sp. Ad46]KZK88436.1 3-(3-hydroxy-phenyl)propionate/3-hydroxycinnamic acid hydroxylase [Pseudovibrio sp. Ad46]
MTKKKIFEVPLYPYVRSPDQDAEKAVRHKVVVVGAGPIGLAAAIELAMQDVEVVVVDDNDKVSWGSRAVCYAKRPLEILDRIGCGDQFVDKGVQWNVGKVFFDERQVYQFDLLPEDGHKRPAFINLQQYYFEEYLVDRVKELQAQGKPIEIRGNNKVVSVDQGNDFATVELETPEGNYSVEADWVIACDGAASPIRAMMGMDFVGRIFEDNFLIADVVMEANFPTERWFWFDPPFNRGQSALLHKQPDNVWRIDLQLGWDVDKEEEKKPENVIPRLKAMLGEDVNFELEWVSIYTFQCRRMEQFRKGRVIFAGDSAHQVSPFGARGANSGLQDTDNLIWKLKLVMDGTAPMCLLDTYDEERVFAAEENILNSSRSTDFITPKSAISRVFRNAVLDLSEAAEFARPLVNSGRLSVPATYDGSSLNSDDCAGMPVRSRPGSPAADAPTANGWLLDQLGNKFQLLAINTDVPDTVDVGGVTISALRVKATDEIKVRYLGDKSSAVYLMRPDQHVAARWETYDGANVAQALNRAIGIFEQEAAQ